MKTTRHLLTLFLLMCSLSLWAQFGPGPGGGFGAGRPPGGGRSGERPGQMQNPNRQLLTEDTDQDKASGPKIGSVTGTITDENNVPFEYATIAVIDAKTQKVITGGISNIKGKFNIKQLPAGDYLVKITFIGFSEYISPTFTLSSSNRTKDIGTIVLKENVNLLDDIVVVADVTTIENHIDKQVVNVGKDLMTAGASARDVFENLPMVDVDFDGNVSMRGSENVRVLLDNRPTNMSVQDLIESLPADAINKIELITNPSAKQDPDGDAGIINIITKKGLLYGLNFSTRVGVDTRNKWNGGVNLGYYYGKVMVYANYNFRYSSRDDSGETYRGNYNTSALYPNPYLNYQTTRQQNSMNSHRLSAGIDYLPNKKTALSYSMNYSPSTNNNLSESYSYFLPLEVEKDRLSKEIAQQLVEQYAGQLDDYFNRYRHSDGTTKRNTLRNSLTFRRDYSATENLIIDANFETSNSQQNSLIENRLGNTSTEANTLDRSNSEENNKEFTLSADYTKEVRGKYKFEVGGRADMLWRDTPYFYFQEFLDNPALGTQPDMDRSNHFKYSQQIYSLYATYSRSIKNFSFQLGLRAEETLYTMHGLGMKNDNGNIVYIKDEDVKIDRDYFEVYPSIFLMYKFGESNDIALNYSRRVARPNSRNLNPTPRFTDPLYVTIGNPYLDPSFTNSIELKYSRSIGNKGFFNLSYFFRNSTNTMQRVTQRENPVDPDKTEAGTLYTTTINIGSQYTMGLNLHASYRPVKWWSTTLNMNYYYNQKDIPDRDDYIRSSNDFSLRWRNSFNISRTGTRLQFGLRYSAPRATLQGSSSGSFTADAGASQDFLKERLSLSIRVQDLFNTMASRGTTYETDFVLFNNNSVTSRIVNFSLSYRFAEMKFKDKRLKGLQGGGDLPSLNAEAGN